MESDPSHTQTGGAGEQEPFSPADLENAVGMIGEYVLMQKIGYGASCKVYIGKHVETGETVAIKVPRAGFSNESFKRLTKVEVEAMCGLNHDNVIRLRNFGVTELLEGEVSQGEVSFLALEIA